MCAWCFCVSSAWEVPGCFAKLPACALRVQHEPSSDAHSWGPGARSLPECFRLFDAIHACTTTHECVQRIAREAAEDFAADGCIYLELRTMPKARLQAVHCCNCHWLVCSFTLLTVLLFISTRRSTWTRLWTEICWCARHARNTE